MQKKISHRYRLLSIGILCLITLSHLSLRASDDLSFDDLLLQDMPPETPAKQPLSEKQPRFSEPEEFDFNVDEEPTPQEGVSQATPIEQKQSRIDQEPEEFGLELTIPIVGRITLIPFADPTNQESGLKARFADRNKKITVGALTIDDGEIKIIEGKTSITGKATLFEKQARFGAKEVLFTQSPPNTSTHLQKKSTIEKLILGFTFIDKPTLTLFDNKTITLSTADLILESNKPIVMQTNAQLFNQATVIGFSLTQNNVDASLSIPTNTPLIDIVPQVQHTPIEQAIIKDAALTVHSINQESTRGISITGTIDLQGLILEASISYGKNRNNPTSPSLSFHATSTAKEYAPFTNTPGLQSFKITDLNATIRADKENQQFQLKGDIYLFGKKLNGLVEFVKNEKDEKGVFVEIPLTKETKLSDIAPELTMLNGLQLQDTSFQLSSIDFTNTKTDKKIKKGLSLTAKVPLTGPLADAGRLLGASNQLFEIDGTIYPNAPQESSFGIILSRGTPDSTKTISLNEIRLRISGTGQASILVDVIVNPEPIAKPNERYFFKGTVEVGPLSSEIKVRMDGTIKDILSLGADLKDPALEFGVLNGQPQIPTRGGFTIELLWKDMTFYGYAVIDWVQTPPIIAFDIGVTPHDAQTKVSSTDLLNLLAQLIKKKLPDTFPKIDFYDISMRLSNSPFKTVTVGSKTIPPGVQFKTKMDIFKRMGQAEFFIGCDDPVNCGFKAFGTIDPINVLDILTITGNSKDTLQKKFATHVRTGENKSYAEFEERKQSIIENIASQNNKPIIDIECTLLRQKFLIDGVLRLAIPRGNNQRFTLFESSTFASLSGQSVLINTQGNIGGDLFSYINERGERIPILMSHVTLYSDIGFEQANFSLDILFANYFKNFIKQQITSAFDAASKKVKQDITKAQNEINKIDTVIANADNKIRDAQASVAKAKESLEDINKAIEEVREAFRKPHRDVDSIKREIDALHEWYKTLTDAEKAGRAIDFGVRIAGLEIAHKTSLGVLKGSERLAIRALLASKAIAEQSLRLGTGFLNDVVRKASPTILKSSAQAAHGILEGTKQTTTGLLAIGKITAQTTVGTGLSIDINRAEFHGSLEDIKTGMLPAVLLEGDILNEPFSFRINIDVTKGINGLNGVIAPIATQIANIPIRKAERALSALSTIFKTAEPQANLIAKETRTLKTPTRLERNLNRINADIEHAKEVAQKELEKTNRLLEDMKTEEKN